MSNKTCTLRDIPRFHKKISHIGWTSFQMLLSSNHSLFKVEKSSSCPNLLNTVYSSLHPRTVISSSAEWLDWYYSSLAGGDRGRRYPSHNTLEHLSSTAFQMPIQQCHYRITIPTANPAAHPPSSPSDPWALISISVASVISHSVQELTLNTDSFCISSSIHTMCRFQLNDCNLMWTYWENQPTNILFVTNAAIRNKT